MEPYHFPVIDSVDSDKLFHRNTTETSSTMPSITESKDDGLDEFMLFPITDIDDDDSEGDDADDENENGESSPEATSNGKNLNSMTNGHNGHCQPSFQPLMTLKQRRRSKLGGRPLAKLHVSVDRRDSGYEAGSDSPRANWLNALRKLRKLKDPWRAFRIEDLPIETCTRYRYHALKKKWVIDRVKVKVETTVSCLRFESRRSFVCALGRR